MPIKSPKIRPIVSVIILIMATFFCQPGPVGGASILTTDRDIYNYGEAIKVNFSDSPGNERDWICIVPVGSPDTEAGDYKYMPKGWSQGSLIFPPPSPGKYEVRAYYNYSRNGYAVSGRYPFSVVINPEAEATMAQRMERKIDPNNPFEANLLPEQGLVYIFRESVAGSTFTDPANVKAQIMVDRKHVVVMPNASYFLFSAPAGKVNFTTGRLTQWNAHKGDIEEVWSVRVGDATINVRPGYVYYLKLSLIFMGGYGPLLDNVPHKEGADIIESYKLTQLKK